MGGDEGGGGGEESRGLAVREDVREDLDRCSDCTSSVLKSG